MKSYEDGLKIMEALMELKSKGLLTLEEVYAMARISDSWSDSRIPVGGEAR